MKNMKFNLTTLLFVFIGIVIFLPVMGQPPVGPPPSSTPIDGGLSLVIAACAGYGAKKMNDRRKAQNKVD
jgi:hypothetical protein